MDPKELRGLYEAYSEVYAPQEENIEEGLRSAVKRLFGGKEQEPAAAPESRGAELRKKYNVGPEKSDTSAKRQILDRSRAKAERDEKEYGDSKYSKSVAQKSKDAHNRYLKAGYSKYGADDARGSGNKARKRAAALSQEDFNWIVDTLLDEGYDLSTYTVEEFYNMCIDEAVKGESSERRKDLATERRAGHRPLSKKEGERYASHKLSQMAYVQRKRMGEELEIDEAMSSYEKNRQRAAQRAAARNAARDSGQTGNVPGVGYVSPRREKETWTDEGGKERHKTGARMPQKEEFDVFDVVLEFLQAEGYAETLEEAEWLMANVIDEEAIEIVLGEAQHARENPQGHDKEEKKKSAPVRGERTPMPPRGDKRREDFEKWYAANVR